RKALSIRELDVAINRVTSRHSAAIRNGGWRAAYVGCQCSQLRGPELAKRRHAVASGLNDSLVLRAAQVHIDECGDERGIALSVRAVARHTVRLVDLATQLGWALAAPRPG